MSETYQSRVFTFVSRRTNQFKDTCAKGWRHLKVAVVWSGQILLYPLHLLIQSTKIFQPQLPPPHQHRSLPQPVSDINIEQALELVENAGYPIELPQTGEITVDNWSFSDENPDSILTLDRNINHTSPTPTIRGLCSLLADRQLALVTSENQILDILTTTQQQEIRRRIGIDLAINWHQWHTHKLSENPHPPLAETEQLLPASETTLDRDLPSPNILDRLSNWFQNNQQPRLESIPESKPKILDRLPPDRSSFTPPPPQLDRFLELPQLPPINEPAPAQIPESNNSLRNLAIELQPEWLKKLWNYYRDYLYIPDPTGGELVHQPAEFALIAIAPKSSKISAPQAPDKADSIVENSAKLSAKFYQDLAGEPDWIETDSEILGYSQSPIARFLVWLDRILLQIENWLIKIWNKLSNKEATID